MDPHHEAYIQTVSAIYEGVLFRCSFTIAQHPDVGIIEDSPLSIIQEKVTGLTGAIPNFAWDEKVMLHIKSSIASLQRMRYIRIKGFGTRRVYCYLLRAR